MREKNVVITGASRGIGAAIARVFAADGYNVVVTYNKNKTKAVSLAHKLSDQYKTEVFCLQLNVRCLEDIDRAYKTANEHFGFIDTLINNAAISSQKLFCELGEEEWNETIDTNLNGAYRATKRFLPKMISEKRGCIINISSVWGQTGASCEVHYSAAKAGIIGMSKALAKEVGPSNIRVNCICPGVIKTDMLSSLSKKELDMLAEDTPLCRLGTPSEVAQAALFLASEKASFITGQILGVNGGFFI